MINCPFDYQDTHISVATSLNRHAKTVYLPLHIALSSCSKDVCQLLMDYSVNVLTVDLNHYNVLHACVVSAFNRPEIERQLCSNVDWFLTQITSDQVRQLMHQENKDGFRPVEFAAQQGCLMLMKTFLGSSAYVTKVEKCGYINYQYYDVTEYEIGNRHSRSPINMLPYINLKKFNEPNFEEVVPILCS